jgi:hypothetical protein
MALRLQYDEVIAKHATDDLATGLREFIANHPSTPKRIYCTYTAMLALRRELSAIVDVKEIDA